MRAFEGRLGRDGGTLADALELMSRLDKELSRLYVYASMVADEDARLSEPQGMQQEMQNLYAAFGAQASFVEPELLRVGAGAIEGFLAGEPRLAPFAFLLRDVIRRASHTLSDAEEKLLADASPLASSATNIYTILSNADFPYPTITLGSGASVKVDQAGYTALRASANRDDRKAAMSTFFGALGTFSRTFGTTIELERAEGAVLFAGQEVRARTSRRRSTGRTFRSPSTCA